MRKRPLAEGVAEESDDELSWDEVARRTKRRNSQRRWSHEAEVLLDRDVPGKQKLPRTSEAGGKAEK